MRNTQARLTTDRRAEHFAVSYKKENETGECYPHWFAPSVVTS
jgi:hypothetical protein